MLCVADAHTCKLNQFVKWKSGDQGDVCKICEHMTSRAPAGWIQFLVQDRAGAGRPRIKPVRAAQNGICLRSQSCSSAQSLVSSPRWAPSRATRVQPSPSVQCAPVSAVTDPSTCSACFFTAADLAGADLNRQGSRHFRGLQFVAQGPQRKQLQSGCASLEGSKIRRTIQPKTQ
jgi:hypothetical protein